MKIPLASSLFAIAATALLIAGCATTQLTAQWADPALRDTPFKKIVVVFQSRSAAERRTLEDVLAARIPNAIQGYKALDDGDVGDAKRAAEKLKTAGFDSAVVVRILSVEKEKTYVPGAMHLDPVAPYGRLWGAWGHGWARAYDPGYTRTDETATIALTVYRLSDERLVWASKSETFNPTSQPQMITDVVRANAEAARRQFVR